MQKCNDIGVFQNILITFAPMKQQEYNIYIKEGCEIKTAQMLDALGIAHRLPFTAWRQMAFNILLLIAFFHFTYHLRDSEEVSHSLHAILCITPAKLLIPQQDIYRLSICFIIPLRYIYTCFTILTLPQNVSRHIGRKKDNTIYATLSVFQTLNLNGTLLANALCE